MPPRDNGRDIHERILVPGRRVGADREHSPTLEDRLHREEPRVATLLAEGHLNAFIRNHETRMNVGADIQLAKARDVIRMHHVGVTRRQSDIFVAVLAKVLECIQRLANSPVALGVHMNVVRARLCGVDH